LAAKPNAFLRPLKKKGFKEKSRTQFGLEAIGMSTTLESNKSLTDLLWRLRGLMSKVV